MLVYFVLYTFPFPLSYVPLVGGGIAGGVDAAWKTIAPWVGARLLGIEGEMFIGPTGSGDTTLDYVKLFVSVVVTIIVTLLWSLLDRRPRSYATAGRWLLLACRFYLGLTMLTYGFSKILPNQMPFPPLDSLLTPYAESSPMGLVWRFIGVSTAYSVFAGLGETIGGLLVFFRHTRALGAAVLIAVLANVVVINFAYDVPVKLYSSHLLLMALAVLLVDRRRLFAVFVLNRPAPAADLRPLLPRGWPHAAGRVVTVLFLGWIVSMQVVGGLESYRTFGNGRERPELWGIHDVESFVKDGREVPALLTDTTRWRALVIDRALPMQLGPNEIPGVVAVWHMDGTLARHRVELDETAQTITFLPRERNTTTNPAGQGPARRPDTLRYERLEDGILMLSGTWEGGEVDIRLRERNIDDLLLVGRGFRWISEFPDNR